MHSLFQTQAASTQHLILPWWLLHSPSISNILGSPLQLRLHLHQGLLLGTQDASQSSVSFLDLVHPGLSTEPGLTGCQRIPVTFLCASFPSSYRHQRPCWGLGEKPRTTLHSLTRLGLTGTDPVTLPNLVAISLVVQYSVAVPRRQGTQLSLRFSVQASLALVLVRGTQDSCCWFINRCGAMFPPELCLSLDGGFWRTSDSNMNNLNLNCWEAFRAPLGHHFRSVGERLPC